MSPNHRIKNTYQGRFAVKTRWSIQKLIYIGMLAAVAGAFMSLGFFVPMMPPFYKINFNGVPSIIALFLVGPALAAWMEVIRVIIKPITVGANSMYIGGFANPIGVALFVIPIWVAYKEGGKIRRVAITSLVISVPIRTLFACFCNAFIALPLCAAAMGLPLNQAITMVAAVNPAIGDLATFISSTAIPFDLIKLGLNCFVGHLLYTRLLAVYPAVRTA